MMAIFQSDDDNAKIETSLSLGQEFLSGNWNLLTKEDLEIRKILGGQSNLLHLVSTNSNKLKDDETRKFLIRVHCQPLTPHQISQDTLVFAVLAERGLGPNIYGCFEGGRLEEYLESKTLTEGDYLSVDNAKKIGAKLQKLHLLRIPISKRPQCFLKMREWLEDFRKEGGESHEIVQTHVNYENIPTSVTIADLENELNLFEQMCAAVFADTVVFCHNDLAAMNILELESNGEMLFIDFEYSSYNWRGFDLGMHLSEYAWDYRTNVEPFYLLDASLYENNPNLRVFCSSYLNSPNCDELMEECRFFWPVCNMFYAIWALRSYQKGYDNGMNLRANCSDRLALYFYLKNKSIDIYNRRRV